MRLGTLVAVALVPALALAAPRVRPKKKKAVPVKTEPPPDDATPEPSAEPPKDPATSAPPAAGAGAGGNAGSSSAPTPAAEPKKDTRDKEPAEAEPKAADVDVDSLRQEYLALRDELFKSRARASTVASQLYSTRIQIRLTYTTARYYNPAKASIRLDGASVWENASGAIATDDGVRFDGYVAPGRHLVTFRVEATGKDDDTFSSVTENQVVVKAVAGKDLVVAAKAKDGGDIAYEWKKNEKGSYGLGIDVAVKTQARAPGAGGEAPAPTNGKKGKK